ncbi:MAG TPA: DNRLRE domain-containing protein [Gaiellaceae bacterium]|nr:DNRLRE domain-containing protein [Gaiellaceae bacterium]
MPRPTRLTRGALLAVLFLALFALPAVATAAPGDVGFEGPTTTGSGGGVTGEKPESKLWWNDGFWWASMWHAPSGDFHIFRLEEGTQSWVDTGVALDDRPATRADALWDGAAGKLYVASHRFSESPRTGYQSRLYRLSYNASTNTYTRDAGFPVLINNWRTETLVIDKDSSGQLWATWTQGGKVWMNRTLCNPTCNDASWGTAFSLPISAVKADDISSLIAFGGNQIGLMWSNQNNWSFGFAVHSDSGADEAWSIETALSGTQLSDDHINLKSDSAGRVYAAIKTSKTSNPDPLTMLLVRQAGGGWSSHVYGREQDNHTRPIVQLDEANGVIHMYATDSGSGGSIVEKTTPMSSISFAAGKGTPVIKDADGKVNNATSTKQNVSSATGLVVLAASNNWHYMHSFQPLDGSGGGGGTPPSASFTASPTSGVAPLTVQFADTSSGSVDTRAWDFQNDGTVDSTAASPTFTYTGANTYTAKLTVTNAFGSSSTTRTITVNAPSGGGSSLTFTPTDDAYVRSNSLDENTGGQTTLRGFKNLAETNSYLKFSVAGVSAPVTSVTLRLFVVDGSTAAGSIYGVADTGWSEGTITWSTRPDVGSLLAAGGSAPAGTWVEFDLGAAVAGDGTHSFALKDGNGNAVWYSSKEGANDPQLVVTFGA